jgi:transcriptional regulator with XRE-family HTH domain
MNDEARVDSDSSDRKAPAPAVDVGKELRKAREKRGETLEVLSKRSRIPLKYLKALESNRRDAFPARCYLRGFLESYCREIDADFGSLWDALRQSDDSRDSQRPQAPQNPSRGMPGWLWPAILGGAAFLAALGIAFWIARNHASSTPRQVPPPAPAAAQAPVLKPAPPDGKTPPPHPSAGKPVHLNHAVIEFGQDVWASIAADGVPHFEGRVPKGKEQRWKFKKSLAFKLSSPNAIQLRVNDKQVPLPSPDPDGTYRVYAATAAARHP